jgi:hypothetical protein
MAICEHTVSPCTPSGAAPSGFLPRAFIEAVTDAVLPLIDDRDGTQYIQGKSHHDARRALVPLFGEYTVEDAVHVHRMLRHADGHWRPRHDIDDPRVHALYEAREALVRFICHAQGSGPACAAARAAFAHEGDGDGDMLTDDLYDALHYRIRGDIVDLRASRFAHGQRFGDDLLADHLRMVASSSDDGEDDQ